jgi:hypothetical protein
MNLFQIWKYNENKFFFIAIHIMKTSIFLKHKPNDIWTNVFIIYGGPLWKVNTNSQFICSVTFFSFVWKNFIWNIKVIYKCDTLIKTYD